MIRTLFYWFFPFLQKRTLLFFTDCSDNNAKARVFAHLSEQLKKFNFDIAVYGERNVSDIAFDMYSIVSFWKEKNIKGNIVLGNHAPRDEDYPNGAPFLLTLINQNYVIGNPDTFRLLKILGILGILPVVEIDILKTLELYFPEEKCFDLSQSQFRSLEVLPLLIYLLVNKKRIITKKYLTPDTYNGSEVVFIDNFGNIKTSINSNSLIFLKANKYNLKIGGYDGVIPKNYSYLSDIPKNSLGMVVCGSSGLVEVVVNGSSAADFCKVKVGDKVIFY